ncbi:MAG: hypothetical protein RIC51_11635 [Erythrobacter sp.]|uniref:hypothetical protein n=1 Tax=Erythrobacter sp. TaxID=1042 RepID=UPI0032ED8C9D
MRRVVLAAVLAGFAAPLAAAPDLEDVDLDAERAAIANFQDADQRLQDVGWRIIRGNAEFCRRVVPAIGLQLQDLASYGAPDIARAALGLTGDFAVETAARGSPAALSGQFARNREVVALERFDPNEWPAGERMDWQRLKRAHDHIDAMLAEHGGITVRFADGGEARIIPVDACASRFELMGDGRKAVADGDRVVIGIEFPAFSYPEEVFAGVVAHELAHNFLDHSEWLDRNKRKRRNVRRTEREADRLMPWLLANAGYEPEAAIRFMETWGRKHDGGLFRARTHDGWDERAEFIAAEIPLIRDLIAREGKADWSVHFRRGIDPQKGLDKGRD